MLADGVGQLAELLLVEVRARLPRVGANGIDGHVAQPMPRGTCRRNQRPEPTPEASLVRTAHLLPSREWIIDAAARAE